MEPQSIKDIKHPHICDLCLRHDPMVKNYAQDIELQDAIRSYVQKETGDTVTITEIGKMCDTCYFQVNELAKTGN
jgi:hypothetical protein